MILPRTGPILTGSHHLPSLELQIQILRNLPQHINKQKVVIEVTVLVLPPKTKDTVVFQLISIGGIQIVGMEYFMSGDAFVGLRLVVDREDEGVEQRASGEGDEDEVLVEFLLLVYTAADHEGTSEEGGGVVLDIETATRTQPLASLEVEHQ